MKNLKKLLLKKLKISRPVVLRTEVTMGTAHLSARMELNMLVSGGIIKDMAKEFSLIATGLHMLVDGRTTTMMGKGPSLIQMEVPTLVIFLGGLSKAH